MQNKGMIRARGKFPLSPKSIWRREFSLEVKNGYPWAKRMSYGLSVYMLSTF